MVNYDILTDSPIFISKQWASYTTQDTSGTAVW